MPTEHANHESDRRPCLLANILVPIDFTDRSVAALRYVGALAPPSARIVLLHVVDPMCLRRRRQVGVPRVDPSIVADCELHLRQFRDRCVGEQRLTSIYVRQGRPGVEILRLAHDVQPDLIVLALTEREVERGPFGRTAYAVASRSPCPVLTLREDMEPLPS